MKFPPQPATVLVAAGCIALLACASVRNAGSASVAAVKKSAATTTSKISNFSLAGLLPGSQVKVVEVREKDLKKLPTGHERALAYENERKRGFWLFGGPVDFKEPTLPEPGNDPDGSLLPPRIP